MIKLTIKFILTRAISLFSSALAYYIFILFFIYYSLISYRKQCSIDKQKNKTSNSVFYFSLKILILISGKLIYGILINLFYLDLISLVLDSSWNLDNLACYSNSEPTGPTGPTQANVSTGSTEPNVPTGSTEPNVSTGPTQQNVSTGSTEPNVLTNGVTGPTDWNSILNNLPNGPIAFPRGTELVESWTTLQNNPEWNEDIIRYLTARGTRLDPIYFQHYYSKAKLIALEAGLPENSVGYNQFVSRYTNHYVDLIRSQLGSGGGL